MNNDSNLIFEAYTDNFTKTKKNIGSNLMDIVRYGIPKEEEISEIKNKLMSLYTSVKARGTEATEEEKRLAHELMGKLRAFGSTKHTKNEDAESNCIEDLARKHGVSLEDITNQLEMGLKVEMEHTEDMDIAKKIAMDHLAEDPHYYTKLAKMENGENAEMPTNKFMSLKQFINKGPIQVKKPSKELHSTNPKVHDLAKKDSREEYKEGENAENVTPVSVVGNIEDLGNGYSIHFDEIREPDNRYYSIDVYKNAGNHKYIPITSFYPSGNDGDKMHGYVSAENPKSKQIVIDLLNKYKLDLPPYGSKQEDEEGDLMKHMKDKGMIDSKATEDTGKYGRTREEEESRIDPKCWKGYHKQGTKVKGGVRVNNCVKNS